MIVSHTHKLIFLKTLKTAGTSIELALAPHCGPDDIITPIYPEIEGHSARNWQGRFAPWKEVHSSEDLRKNLRELRRQDRIYNHIPARFARARLPEEVWNGYLKVCVERNPWDKTLSHFHMFRSATWHRHYDPNLNLDTYLSNGVFCHNAPFYCDTVGRILVDRVLRYENLHIDLAALFEETGIPFDGLPHAKAELRKDRRSYREVFDKRQSRIIEKAFEHEIELHGWEY